MKNEKLRARIICCNSAHEKTCTVRLITMLCNGSTHFLNFQTINYDFKYTREKSSVRLFQFSSVKKNLCVRLNHFTSPEKITWKTH